jgi:hypothetical protein
MADHCLGAAAYALIAVGATGAPTDAERAWQIEQLPEEVRELIVSALESHRIKSLVSRGLLGVRS